jgi:two-component system sensor histidine kinase KdpD
MHPLMADHPLSADIPADLPPVLISYTQIDQVLTNLLENAAKYTPAGTPVTIMARREAEYVLISVCDRGPGIPEGMESRIFEKFVRTEAPERHAHGTGLGLAICKGIVEAHGGRIWVERVPGGGAAFNFLLPVSRSARHTDAITNTERKQEQEERP